MMMTSISDQPAIDFIDECLAHVTYKPGWKFSAYQHPFEGVWITINVHMEDSYHPGSYTDAGICTAVPEIGTVEEFKWWLAWRLGRVEMHEMQEWLKWDDEPMFDPHGKNANQLLNSGGRAS